MACRNSPFLSFHGCCKPPTVQHVCFLPLLLPRIARISRVVCTSVGLLLLVSKLPPELENSPLLLCASFNIMWIYTDACACVCVYVFAHECCACVLRMHKCVVLTYASGLARFFRVQVCTCVHAYLYMYICIPICVAIECSQVFPCHCAFPSCLPPTCLLHCVSHGS